MRENEPVPSDGLFVVAGHDVLAEIARGGAGIVYRARQREPRREVALKMLLPQQLASAEMCARFRLEAETVAGLDHPGILPVYAVGDFDGLPFFTMKLAVGGTLAARRSSLARQWREIAGLIAALADAVHFAHTRGVIHRDLKPGNVLFDDAGGAYVSDFGLAKFMAATDGPTRSINVLGTPAYLAPEVIERGASCASTAGDVYSLGAILYELLAGRVPFAGDNLTALLRDVTERRPERPSQRMAGVPRDLEVICLRCIEKLPSKRPGSAQELADDLRRWLAGRPICARAVPRVERAWLWARRNLALATLLVLLAALLVGNAVTLWRSNRQLRASLEKTRAAESRAEEKLHLALLSEARLTRQSRQLGQRTRALETLAQAAQIAPTRAVRNEVAATLAKPDLELAARLPASFPGVFSSVGYAPDLLSYLAPQPDGGFVRLRIADGRTLRRFRSPAGMTAILFRFSQDAGSILVHFSNAWIGIYSVDREDPLWTAPPYDGNILHAGLSPRGDRVAFGHSAGTVRLRELATGEERQIAPEGPRVIGVDFDPSGERVLVSRVGQLDFLALGLESLLWSVTTSTSGMRVAWSADGRLFAHGGAAFNEIFVRTAETGGAIAILNGHRTLPSFAEFLPSGQRLLSEALDHSLRLWDVATGAELLVAQSPMRGLGVAPDGLAIGAATADDLPAIFKVAPEDVFREWGAGLAAAGTRIAFNFSGDGRWLAVADGAERRLVSGWESVVDVTLWNSASRLVAGRFSFTMPARLGIGTASVLVAPDNRSLLYSRPAWGIARRALPAETTALGGEEKIPGSEGCQLLGFAGDGQDWLVRNLATGEISLWPAGRGERARTVMAAPADAQISPSPDGRWLTIRDPRTGDLQLGATDGTAPRLLLEKRNARVQFSPNGEWLVASQADGHQLWHLPDLTMGPKLSTDQEGSRLRNCAFSPDGTWLATQRSGTVTDLWRTGSFSPLITLEAPILLEGPSLSWTADGKRLVLGTRGPRVFEWDITALRRSLAERGLDW